MGFMSERKMRNFNYIYEWVKIQNVCFTSKGH